MSKIKECFKGFCSHSIKRKIFTILGIVLVLGGLVYLSTLFGDKAPKQIYEVAIMTRSQDNPDKEEERRTSLKKGDVLVVQKEGHSWSKTEEISYLILKMNLTEAQAQKLSQAKTREIPEKELSEKEKVRIDEEKKRAKEDREYTPERREETLIAREYRIDMSEFEKDGFRAVDLISGQPYQEEVYDWGIVERKK